MNERQSGKKRGRVRESDKEVEEYRRRKRWREKELKRVR